jgi:hypothetical protein
MIDALRLPVFGWTTAIGLVGAGVMLAVMPSIARALRLHRKNFAQQSVTTAYGIAIWLPAAVALGWAAQRGLPGAAPAATALVLFGLVGLADDLWGDRRASGFRGHFRQLLQEGRLTTGLAKLAIGGGASLALGLWLAGDAAPALLRVLLEPAAPSTASLPPLPDLAPQPPSAWFGALDALTGAAVIALAANTLNLFDLRPLRTLKVFGAGSIFLVGAVAVPVLAARWLPLPSTIRDAGDRLPVWERAVLSFPHQGDGWWLALSLLGPAVAAAALYSPLEARRRAMMGDTGANALGALLGVVTCLVLPLAGQAAIAIALAGINLYAETHSLTALIGAHPFWDRLDRWGWKEA